MLELNKIYNMDCLIGMKEIKDKSIDMILCDLPYGTTLNKWDTVIPLNDIWSEYNRIIKDNGVIALTAQTPFDKVLGASNLKMLKYEWIWEKEAGTGFYNAKKAPLKSHENILIFYKSPPVYNPQMEVGKPYQCKKGGGSLNYNKDGIESKVIVTVNTGERYPKTVLRFKRDKGKFHPTQKPVALGEYLINTYTNEGGIVLDSCAGSGSFLVSAVKTMRSFIGFETDNNYCNIANNRIQEAKYSLCC